MSTGLLYRVLKLFNFPFRKKWGNNMYTVCVFTGVNLTDHARCLYPTKIGLIYKKIYNLK